MKPYVYALIDPRDGETFYVGKGTEGRRLQHERQARAGIVVNQQGGDDLPARKTPAKKKAAKPKATRAKPAPQWQAWIAKPEDAMRELCEHVTRGGHMAGLCKSKGIEYTTMPKWVMRDPERNQMYAGAREERADVLADEIVSIADEIEVKFVTGDDGETTEVRMDPTAIARNKLRVDARKWVASKLKPRVYGDKPDVTQELTVRAIPDEQLDAEIAKLTAKLGLAGGPRSAGS